MAKRTRFKRMTDMKGAIFCIIVLAVLYFCDGICMFLLLNGRKEEMFLFNDALNTFYFTVIWRQTYG